MLMLEGGSNSLEIFARVNSKIRVISKPTFHDSCVYIPYEHDIEVLKKTIDCYRNDPKVKVMFGHFDTIGARMNASVVSDRGVDESFWPQHIPVFSGHYHCPQIHGRVEYIGSPFETSLSESGDKKRLLQFDEHWNRLPDLPLDFGKKYFKVSNDTSEQRRNEIVQQLRPKDKIVFDRLTHVPESMVEACEAAGARVVVKKVRQTLEAAAPREEPRTPEAWFDEYVAVNPMDEATVAAGKAAIRRFGGFGETELEQKSVIFEKMTLTDVGPFKGVHTLEFQKHKGLTLVSATRADKNGTSTVDSNGCGKSLLTTGALLLALTGEADPRPSLDGKHKPPSTALIHNGKTGMSVVLIGKMNDMSFRITRILRTAGGKRHTLVYETKGAEEEVWKNETRTTLKLTQQDVNMALFNLPKGSNVQEFVLQTMLWCQHSDGGFVCQSPQETKASLARLTKAEAWAALGAEMKARSKEDKADAQRATVDAARKRALLDELVRSVATETEAGTRWDATHAERLASLTAQESAAQTAVEAAMSEAAAVVGTSQQQTIQRLNQSIGQLEQTIRGADQIMRRWPDVVAPTQTPTERASEALAAAADVTRLQHECNAARSAKAVARSRMQDAKNAALRFKSNTAAIQCTHCFQPIDASHRASHDRTMQDAITKAAQVLSDASATHERHETSLADAKSRVRACADATTTAERWAQRQAAADDRREAVDKLQELRQRVSVLLVEEESHRASLTSVAAHKARLDSARTCLQRVLDERARVLASVNPSVERLRVLRTRVDATRSAASGDEAEATEAESLRARHQLLASVFSDSVPNSIASSLMDDLRIRTNQILGHLHDDSKPFEFNYSDGLKLSKQTAGVLSGGEHRRLALAAFLAFGRLALTSQSIELNVRIFDEPLVGVDLAGQTAFLNLLHRFRQTDQSFYVVSHNTSFHVVFKFDHMLRLVHDNDVSSCVT